MPAPEQSPAQHGEVVLVAEVVGEVMELVGELADRAGRKRRENLQLMPQILGLLAPLVQIGRSRAPSGLHAARAARGDM